MTASIQRDICTLKTGDVLEWARAGTSRPVKALIFAPPLIGGHLSQQIRLFRWFVSKGFDLFTFNYSGHGRSSGKFSLKASVRDTRSMLSIASGIADKEGLNLYGIASCYSAIPLIKAASGKNEPFEKLIFINAIPGLRRRAIIHSFFSYYQKFLSLEGIPVQFLPFRPASAKILTALRHYTETLFPGIPRNRHVFGVLERKRTRLFSTLSQFFTYDPIGSVVLWQTPVLCIYAGSDRILEIFDPAVGRKLNYENEIRKICPRADFFALNSDHFLSSPTVRRDVRSAISDFFHRKQDPVSMHATRRDRGGYRL